MAGRLAEVWGRIVRAARRLAVNVLLLLLGLAVAVTLLEREHLLPKGTLAWLVGWETKTPRRHADRHEDVARRVPRVAATGERIDYAQVDAWLAGIRVAPEVRRGYEREAWPHWLTVDGTCRTAREAALIRDAIGAVTLSDDGCRVLGGRWRDPYTGETVTDPRDLDIDHRVPLEEAYGSGGNRWDRDRRAAYANDLSDRRTLVVVSAAANRAKGAKGPEDWLPPDDAYLCRYVVDWVAVKARWELSMDERERVTVGNILSACRRQTPAHP